jgi:hypothetical protein
LTVCHIIDKLVICGTKDGSIQIWDLNEINHTNLHDSTTFQRPSYSTDGIHTDHQDAIVLLLLNHESSQKAYHIKSIDASFVCCSWVITPVREELKNTYDLDYGMKIGSFISMRKTNSLILKTPNR